MKNHLLFLAQFPVRKLFAVSVGSLLATASCAHVCQAQNEPRHQQIRQSVRDLYSIRSAKSPSFSPDGKKIAFLSNLNGSYQVWLVPIESGYPTLVTNKEKAVHAVEWSPTDANCIAFGTGQGEVKSQIFVIRPDGTEEKLLTPIFESRTQGPQWTADGRDLFGSSTARNESVEEPCLLNPSTGVYQWLSDRKESGRLFDVSPDGKIGLTAYFSSFSDATPFVLDMQTKKESPLLPGLKAGRFAGVLSPDRRNAYCVTDAFGERRALAKVVLDAHGTPIDSKIIASKIDADLSYRYGAMLGFNRKRSQAALVWRKEGANDTLELFDLTQNSPSQVVTLPANAHSVQDVIYSPDGLSLAMAISSELENIEVWFYDIERKKFRKVTNSPHPGIAFEKLVRPEHVHFKTFDGLELDGYLYKPHGRMGPGAYVIDFHGGPDSSASPTNEYQPFLEQGLGVFAPNVRGSGGRGKSFAALDDGALRANAVKDIKACFDFLVQNKIADPAKVGVMGHSAGGFLSMSALTDYPDLFAAGVEDNGTIDLLADTRRLNSLGFDCTEFSGPIENGINETMLREISPAYKTERIRSPFLVQQGADDVCTPDADAAVSQLKKRGADVTYIVNKGEGHNLDIISSRVEFITTEIEFFIKHLKP